MENFLDLLAEAGLEDVSKTAESIEAINKQASSVKDEVSKTCDLIDLLMDKMAADEETKNNQNMGVKPKTAPKPAPAPVKQAPAAPAQPQAVEQAEEVADDEAEAQARALFIQDIEQRMASGEEIAPEEMELYNAIKAGETPAEYSEKVDKVAAVRYLKQLEAAQEYAIKEAAFNNALAVELINAEEEMWEKLAALVAEDILIKNSDQNYEFNPNGSPAETQGAIQQRAIQLANQKTVNKTEDMEKGDDGSVEEALKAIGDLEKAEKKTAALKKHYLNILQKKLY